MSPLLSVDSFPICVIVPNSRHVLQTNHKTFLFSKFLGITNRSIGHVLQKHSLKQLPGLLRRSEMVEFCLPDGNVGSVEVCLENSSPHVAHE